MVDGSDKMRTVVPVGHLGLSETEEDAIVSFMQTLTDGFVPLDRP